MDQLGEWRRRLQDFDPDIRNHFLAKAQGTEVGELAWNFAGRSAETRRIVRWLRDAPSGMFIVTGEPGAGKSALLGRLVSLADEGVRAALQHVGLLPESPAEEVPPAGVFDVVVQLTGKTFGDAVRSIDAGSDLEAVMASLRALGRRFTILFDALDEAQDPQRIAARLLVPLSKLPNVRLVLGTRRSLLEGPDLPQATSAELLDALDAGNAEVLVLAREPAAMLDYVRHRLTTLAPDVVDQVTVRLAQVDQPFLFARLVTSELLQTDGAVDIDRLVAGSHGDVFGLAVEAIWQTSPATVAATM